MSIPEEVGEAITALTLSWRDMDGRGWICRAALVAAIERAIEAAVAREREACAVEINVRIQAERIMRDDNRRLGNGAMADVHGDRAHALAEAEIAIRSGRENRHD